MDEAIKLAIEKGGYNAGLKVTHFAKGHAVDENRVVLDPLFWQALGKALGWKDNEWTCANQCELLPEFKNAEDEDSYCPCCKQKVFIDPTWLSKAHEYLNKVLTGGDTEKFWKDLLTN